MNEPYQALQQRIRYQFKDLQFLVTALTHRSAGKPNNERLEFLGDALLGAVVAEQLFNRFPTATEGQLTRLRAGLVKKETLADMARELSLGDFLKLGPGEQSSGGWRRDSILANAFEALVGAIHLDSDLGNVRVFLLRCFATRLEQLPAANEGKDPKTLLQEYLQSKKMPLPEYVVVEELGQAHEKLFRVECKLPDSNQRFTGQGPSKKAAEQDAANKAMNAIQDHV